MHVSQRGRRGRLALVAAAVLTVAACAPGDTERADTESLANATADEPQDAGATDSAGGEQAGADVVEEAGTGQPIDASAAGEPIGTTGAEVDRGINRDGRVPVRVDVMRLERNGDLVDLTLVVTNEDEADDYKPHASDWNDTTSGIDGVKLIDQGGQRVYLAAIDSEGNCLCSSRRDIELGLGESIELYVTYGGLPAEVSEVDIHLPTFPPINGVPVSGDAG